MKQLTRDKVAALIALGMETGSIRRPSLARFRWEASGNCTNPYLTELWGRADRDRSGSIEYADAWASQPSLYLDILTRCRKCPSCLKVRRNLWWHRADSEIRASSRTWFGTLTLRPEEHFKMLLKARGNESRSGVDFETLSTQERFGLMHNQISPEITKFLKRIRSASLAPMRYLLVTEAHESGYPHYHMLVHELLPDKPVTYRILDKNWTLGFSKWKLVTNSRAASYVCKYLTKSSLARVRASIAYGENVSVTDTSREFISLPTILTPQRRVTTPLALMGDSKEKDVGHNDESTGVL